MKKNLISALIISILPLSSFAQFNKDIEVKAVIKAGCYLSADNVNFGVVMMPIRDQKAQSEMNIICSNNTPYTIAPTYGNKNVISGTVSTRAGNTSNSFFLLVDGKRVSNAPSYDIICYSNEKNRFAFGSDIVAKAYGYTAGNWIDATSRVNKVCNNWYPNSATFSSLSFGDNPGGKMIGAKGTDAIVYILEDPRDTSKIWSTANVYKATGNGQEQKVVFNGKIQKADNKTYHLTNDIYSDSVTLSIVY